MSSSPPSHSVTLPVSLTALQTVAEGAHRRGRLGNAHNLIEHTQMMLLRGLTLFGSKIPLN